MTDTGHWSIWLQYSRGWLRQCQWDDVVETCFNDEYKNTASWRLKKKKIYIYIGSIKKSAWRAEEPSSLSSETFNIMPKLPQSSQKSKIDKNPTVTWPTSCTLVIIRKVRGHTQRNAFNASSYIITWSHSSKEQDKPLINMKKSHQLGEIARYRRYYKIL